MKQLIRNATILHPDSTFNGKVGDVLIENGKIKTIASSIPTEYAEAFDFSGCTLVPAFCDLYVSICDPGFEQRDDISTVAQSALAGGYTVVATLADNQPITQSKAQVEYIINNAQSTGVQMLPIGAITENFDGKSPSEMLDMHHAGAIAFSDMPHSIKDSGVMLRALQYVQSFGGLIITLPFDKTLVGDGQVNEGEISVRMGMYGISNVAEYAALQRDIELLKYASGKLHIMGVSTSESVDLIRKAKAEKLQISCSVFVHHLINTEEDVVGYDSHFKVFPPLRTQQDKSALIQGLKDGTIDCISTQHTPLETDTKNLEFEYAHFGMIGLESAFGLLYKHLEGEISQERLIELLSLNPRRILGLNNNLEEEQKADFTIVDFNKEWIFSKEDIRSKSKNSPYIGSALKGKVKAVFTKGKVVIHGK